MSFADLRSRKHPAESWAHSDTKHRVIDVWKRASGVLLVRQLTHSGRRMWRFDLTDATPRRECRWPDFVSPRLCGMRASAVFDVAFVVERNRHTGRRILAAVEVEHTSGLSYEKRELIEQAGIPVIVVSTFAEHWNEADQHPGSLVAMRVIIPETCAIADLGAEVAS